MSIDGAANGRSPGTAEQRLSTDPRRDPRFTAGRESAPGIASSSESPEALRAKAALGDDRLQLSPETPDNPFEALLHHRTRKRRRKRDGDPTMLD